MDATHPAGHDPSALVREPPVPAWHDSDILTPLFRDSMVGNQRDAVYGLYRGLTARRPVFRDANGAWVVSSHASCEQVLADSRFAAAPPLPPSQASLYAPILGMMLLRDGEQHALLRRHFAPLFKTQHIESVQAFIDADIAALLHRLPRCGSFDVIAEIARWLPGRVACVLLGLDPVHAARLMDLTAPILKLISGAPMSDGAMQALLRAGAAGMNELDDLVRSAPACAGAAALPGPRGETTELDAPTYASNVGLLFLAAYATAMLTLGNVVHAALRIPGLWRRLAEGSAPIAGVVAELCRLQPAAHALQRYAVGQVSLGPHILRAGDPVVAVVAAANRDPRAFPQPDALDPLRAGTRSFTFGAGPHACLGAGLARRQVTALLGALAQRYPAMTLARRAPIGLQIGTFVGYGALWVDCASPAAPPVRGAALPTSGALA